MKLLTGLWLSLLMMFAGVALAQQPGRNYNAGGETGRESSSSNKSVVDSKRSESVTNTVSVNSYLLQAYIEGIEQPSPTNPKTLHCIVETHQYAPDMIREIRKLGALRVLTAPKLNFPVWEWEGEKIMSAQDFQSFLANYHRTHPYGYITRADNVQAQRGTVMGYGLMQAAPPTFIANERTTGTYLMAVSFAHHVLVDAGQRLAARTITSRDQLDDEAKRALCDVDYDAALADARNDITTARCVGGMYPEPSIVNPSGWTAPFVMNCGSIVVDAEAGTYRINGRPTLSQEMIGGNDIKMALASERGKSQVAEKSTSRFKKDTKSTNVQRQN